MKFRKITKTLLISLFFFLIPANAVCASRKKTAHQEEQEVWITVFVHGIMSVQPHMNLETVFRLFKDEVEDSFYAHTVKTIRTDPFFHRNQAMQELGMQAIDKQSSYTGDASCALAILFDEVYAMKGTNKPEQNHYYTFGWSGLLSPSIRLREARSFYVSLGHIIQKFRKRGINPKIRVIGYSHGGNIVLGAAQGRRDNLTDFDYLIDEVILLGVPIQSETDFYINDPFFKKIYNVYSMADRIQTVDCFAGSRFGSNKYFKKRYDLVLPNKLTQIELKLLRNTNNKTHKPRNRDKRFNFDDPAIVSGRSHGLRDSSPGHCELWFFGWTHAHYRTHFPFSPLPIVAILPYILETIKEVEHTLPRQEHIIADIRPHQETLVVRTKNSCHKKHICNFLNNDQLEDLKDRAREFSFKRVTYEDYKEHIKAAFEQTREQLANMLFDSCPEM